MYIALYRKIWILMLARDRHCGYIVRWVRKKYKILTPEFGAATKNTLAYFDAVLPRKGNVFSMFKDTTGMYYKN